MEERTVLEEQIQSAKKSWLILYPVDVAVTAYFAFIIFGVAAAYIAGKNYLASHDIGSALGSFSMATIFIVISVLFGWGTTHTEKTLHMDEKKGNDYVVIVLIVLTGIIASGARYIDTQKTLYTNAEEYLSKNNAEYQGYMGMLKNGFAGDDDKAIAAMEKMKKEYISSQTSAGDTWRTFYEIPFAMILAVLINFCFGLMVSKYYRLRRKQEEGGNRSFAPRKREQREPIPEYTPSPIPVTAQGQGGNGVRPSPSSLRPMTNEIGFRSSDEKKTPYPTAEKEDLERGSITFSNQNENDRDYKAMGAKGNNRTQRRIENDRQKLRQYIANVNPNPGVQEVCNLLKCSPNTARSRMEDVGL